MAVLLTVALRAAGTADGVDQTRPDDYRADAGDPRVTTGPTTNGKAAAGG